MSQEQLEKLANDINKTRDEKDKIIGLMDYSVFKSSLKSLGEYLQKDYGYEVGSKLPIKPSEDLDMSNNEVAEMLEKFKMEVQRAENMYAINKEIERRGNIEEVKYVATLVNGWTDIRIAPKDLYEFKMKQFKEQREKKKSA